MLTTFRAFRALAALQAVWCLGCTSFDVLLDRAFGDPAAQVEACATMTDGGGEPSGEPGVTAGRDHAPRSQECGCEHCVAVSTPSCVPGAAPDVAPQSVPRIVSAPVSIDRKPLVPPPLA